MNTSTPSLVRLVNPVGQIAATRTPLARRLDSLNGKSIGFISNIKPNADFFLSCIEELIRADHAGIETHSVRKNFSSCFLIAPELEGKVEAVVNAWGD
ncbi:MAG: hypothetical protein HY423_09760 [Candidatus Lambdaproteobacteria bacterium]|nr:hypothetical protein [Candidatus Lambdaproteobacteria bacterium]